MIISAKLINKILANCIQQHNKKMFATNNWDLYLECQDDSIYKV